MFKFVLKFLPRYLVEIQQVFSKWHVFSITEPCVCPRPGLGKGEQIPDVTSELPFLCQFSVARDIYL
jgi:hypothetical protein